MEPASSLRYETVDISVPHFPHVMVLSHGSRDFSIPRYAIACCDCERGGDEEAGSYHGDDHDAEGVYGVAHVVALLDCMSDH